jgi:creatinine amidohydrolase
MIELRQASFDQEVPDLRQKAPVPVAALAAFAILVLGAAAFGQAPAGSNELTVKYEELTSPDFIKAVAKSASTCLVPIGILEKHGPHLPLGTDLIDVRELSVRAAKKEYTIVFPPYYVGQIFEAKHQPGTIAYSTPLMIQILQETCDELARNGVKKIILVNGHGGNTQFLQFFCQSQLARKKDYAVFLFDPSYDDATEAKIAKLRKTTLDGHGGEEETSTMLAHRPDLVHLDRAKEQSGEDQKRLSDLKYAYTGIWWYASQPNHYRGYGEAGNKEFGEFLLNLDSDLLAETIRSVKADTKTIELQNMFFDGAAKPLETKQ